MGESMKFRVLVYFYLYFTILMVPESLNEAGALSFGIEGPYGLQKEPQGINSTFLTIFPF